MKESVQLPPIYGLQTSDGRWFSLREDGRLTHNPHYAKVYDLLEKAEAARAVVSGILVSQELTIKRIRIIIEDV